MLGYKSTPEMRRKLVDTLLDLWEARPHERLGQLISNTIGDRDLFDIRDEHLMTRLNANLNRPNPIQKRKYQDNFKFDLGKVEVEVLSAYIDEASSPTIFYNCYCDSSPRFEAIILAEYIIDYIINGCTKQ